MADSTSTNPQLENLIRTMVNDQRNAAKLLSDAAKQLSDSGVQKLTDNIKDFLKQHKILDKETTDQIKTTKDLTQVLKEVEKQHEAVIEVLKDESKLVKYFEKDKKIGHRAAVKLAAEQTKSRLDELGASQDLVDALKAGVPEIRKLIKSTQENAGYFEHFRSVLDHVNKSLESQIAQYAEIGYGFKLMGQGIRDGYQSLVTLTNKGLLGAFTTIQMIAPKLLMTAKEFENIINDQRDMVTMLGGGTKGIEAFAEQIDEIGDKMKFLGAAQSLAAARFIKMSKIEGITPLDGKLFSDNIDKTTNQFKKFNRLFGDTYDDYAALMESLSSETLTRTRLNSLDKQRVGLELDEMRRRTENLKLMGLSNTQIVEFNQKIGSLIDPNKNDIEKRITETTYAKAGVQQMLRMVSSHPEDAGVATEVERNRQGLNKYFEIVNSGTPEALQKFAASDEGANALKAYALLRQTTSQDRYAGKYGQGYAARNFFNQGAGDVGEVAYQEGSSLLTASAQELNRKQLHFGMGNRSGDSDLEVIDRNAAQTATGTVELPEWMKKLTDLLPDTVKNFFGIKNGSADLSTAFGNLEGAIKGVESALTSPLGKLATGALVVVGSYKLLHLVITSVSSLIGGLGTVVKFLMSPFASIARLFGFGGAAAAAETGVAATAETAAVAAGGMTLGGVLGAVGTGAAIGVPIGMGLNWLYGKISGGSSIGSDVYEGFHDPFGDKKRALLAGGNPATRSVTGKIQNQAPQAMTPPSSQSSSTSIPFDYQKYAQAVASREQDSRGYSSVNQFGYVGKYQMGAAALTDVGLVKPGTTNKGLNDPKNWNLDGGLQTFLNSPQIQEDAMQKYTDQHYQALLRAGVITSSSTPEEIAGYLQAAHLKGVGGAIALKRGQVTYDGNGTSTSSYFNSGASSQGSSPSLNVASAYGGGDSAQVVATTTPSSPAAGSVTDPTDAELKKHTQLLTKIAENTAPSRTSRTVSSENYPVSPSVAANAGPS